MKPVPSPKGLRGMVQCEEGPRLCRGQSNREKPRGARGGLGNPARFPVRHHSCKSDAKSGNQSVTAAFGDQKLHIAGIGFDLLTQAVDMGFQRMRGDPRIIPPNLV